MSLPMAALGRTGIKLSRLGFGTAPIGGMFENLDDGQVQDTLAAAYAAGIRHFDTAPLYGLGHSEHRLGRFLRQLERKDYVLSTKAGRILRPAARPLKEFDRGIWAGGLPFEVTFDYSYDGIMRSYEDSIQRLGVTSIDLLVIHDLDTSHHKTEARLDAYTKQMAASGWRALEELRRNGDISGAGAGVNMPGTIHRLLDLADFDFFLVATSYSLLEHQVLETEFPRCQKEGAAIVIAGAFHGGILATGAKEGAIFNYAPAPDAMLAKTRAIEIVCARHHVELAAAALQFPLLHPAVTSLLFGAITPGQVARNIALGTAPVPAAFWAELKAQGLLPRAAPVKE